MNVYTQLALKLNYIAEKGNRCDVRRYLHKKNITYLSYCVVFLLSVYPFFNQTYNSKNLISGLY